MNGICHAEIPATDFTRVGKFYENVFGWETTYIEEMDYALFKAPDGVGGGFSKQLSPSDNPSFMLYIEVEDIDTALIKIGENGGQTISGKTQISPEHGFYAMFKDCEGNSIGLWGQK